MHSMIIIIITLCCSVLKNAQFVNTVVDVQLNHFTCPLCKKIGNTIMPYRSKTKSRDGSSSSSVATVATSDREWLLMMTAADDEEEDDTECHLNTNDNSGGDDYTGIGNTESDVETMGDEWNR